MLRVESPTAPDLLLQPVEPPHQPGQVLPSSEPDPAGRLGWVCAAWHLSRQAWCAAPATSIRPCCGRGAAGPYSGDLGKVLVEKDPSVAAGRPALA